jgi:hypothetical protein
MNYFIMHDWLIAHVWFGLIRELSQRLIVEGEIGFGIVRFRCACIRGTGIGPMH